MPDRFQRLTNVPTPPAPGVSGGRALLRDLGLAYVRPVPWIAASVGLGIVVVATRLDDRVLQWFGMGVMGLAGLAAWQVWRERPRPLVVAGMTVLLGVGFAPRLEPILGLAVLIGVVAFAGSAAMIIPSRLTTSYLMVVATAVAVSLMQVESDNTWVMMLSLVVIAGAFGGTAQVYRAVTRCARTSRNRYELLVETAADAIVSIDDDQKITVFNEAAQSVFGYSPAEVLGEAVDILLPDRFRQNHYSHILNFADEPVGRRPMSARQVMSGQRKDGTEFPIAVTIAKRSTGEGMEFTAIIRDITDLVEAQDELEALIRSKNDLITSISHELRTPLTAVLGFAELLQDTDSSLTPEERSDIVRTIANQSTDLANIIDDLLVAAKAEVGMLVVLSVPVDLRAQIDQTLEGFNHRRIPEVIVAGPSVTASGDPVRIRQILRNLLSNAFKHGGEHIRVQLGEGGPVVSVAVIDDGPGVPPEESDSIFEPYHRSSDIPGQPASLGLGLSISRQLAHLMGGDVTYRHESDDSTFLLTLPAA